MGQRVLRGHLNQQLGRPCAATEAAPHHVRPRRRLASASTLARLGARNMEENITPDGRSRRTPAQPTQVGLQYSPGRIKGLIHHNLTELQPHTHSASPCHAHAHLVAMQAVQATDRPLPNRGGGIILTFHVPVNVHFHPYSSTPRRSGTQSRGGGSL